jgi:hypothetical protein
MENKFNYNNTLEFRQIVLGHIKRILEISSHELRDSTRRIMKPNTTETIEQEDTRYSYIQSIENLAFVLMPYFDKEITKIYNECCAVINSYDFKIEKQFKKEIDAILTELGKDSLNLKPYCLDKKIFYAKKLFIELNKLLHRNDYLKSTVYGDESDEVASESEEGGSE